MQRVLSMLRRVQCCLLSSRSVQLTAAQQGIQADGLRPPLNLGVRPQKHSRSSMKGSCACRAVTYLAGDPIQLVNCHCNLCRSINGSAFSSYVVAKSDTVHFSGKQALSSYPITEKSTKHFCSKCGTPMFNSNLSTYPSLTMLYLGTVAESNNLSPSINIFCSSKLPWVDAIGNQHSFTEAPKRGA